MLLSIYLQPEGVEKHALGKELNSWDFACRPAECRTPEGYLKLQEVEVSLPHSDVATESALLAIAAEEKELLADHHVIMTSLQARKNNLLSLSYSPVNEIEGQV